MSRWEEQFTNHPIHATLEWLRDSASKEFDDIDENEVPEKRRFLKLISKYEDVFQNLDPEIVPFSQLDSLNSTLRNQNITNQITSYIQNGNVAHLTKANNLITSQLNSLCLLMSISQSAPPQVLINDLEKLIDSSTATLIEKKDTLVEEFKKLNVSASENDKKIFELSSQIEQKKSELTLLFSEWQSQFSNAQDSRSQEFSKWRDNFSTKKNTEIAILVQKCEEKLNASASNFDKNIEDILVDGNAKHQAILDLYEITAGDSVGAGYLKNANTEKKQADNWRIISVSFIFFTVCWLLFAYFYNTQHLFSASTVQTYFNNTEKKAEPLDPAKENTKNHDATATKIKDFPSKTMLLPSKTMLLPWYTLFVTFSLSGVLLWGSAYSAQQSTKHRNNEKRTRWFALEVKAIDPFISSLEPAERNELKKQLCERIFGQNVNGVRDETKVIDEHVFKTVADTLSSILSKIPR